MAKQSEKGLMIPKSSKDVPATIKALEEQLAALKGGISAEVSIDIDYNGKNIKNVKTIKELMEISASIHARSAAYNAELKRYGLENKNVAPFTQTEKTVDEWFQIIDKAKNELINNVQIAKIESAIKSLSKHLDAETKLEMELKEIMQDAQKPLA
jgi:uncharacterized protein YqgV (UPF0045/DUF77 family)